MIFSSNIFIFWFLPICLLLYFLFSYLFKTKSAILNIVLILFSLFFYLWGSGSFVFVFIASIFLNYLFGLFLYDRHYKKVVLFLGISLNIGLLFFFKYFNFVYNQITSINLNSLQFNLPTIPHIFLPIGISFYTFMAISYLIDIYQQKFKPASLIQFATYLTLFPHLVAGPIVRFLDISKEIKQRIVTSDTFYKGIIRFSYGLGKKVIIANNLSVLVDKIFALPLPQLTPVLAWVGIIAYTFQIYYDFSGYTDMAIGLAYLFGFKFPENFNRPYISKSITEFWRRWHITLSSWFRDYLYIPLGGNRKGNRRTYFNIILVFLLCGLWHGAAWMFIIWGLYHGALLVFERYLKNTCNFEPKNVIFSVITFFLIMIGWVFFRSPTLSYALSYLHTMFNILSNQTLTYSLYTIHYYLPINMLFFLSIAGIFSFIPKIKINNRLIKGIFSLIILVYSLAFLSKTSFTPFIYFQF